MTPGQTSPLSSVKAARYEILSETETPHVQLLYEDPEHQETSVPDPGPRGGGGRGFLQPVPYPQLIAVMGRSSLHPLNLSWGDLVLPCNLDLEFHYELLESHVPFQIDSLC